MSGQQNGSSWAPIGLTPFIEERRAADARIQELRKRAIPKAIRQTRSRWKRRRWAARKKLLRLVAELTRLIDERDSVIHGR